MTARLAPALLLLALCAPPAGCDARADQPAATAPPSAIDWTTVASAIAVTITALGGAGGGAVAMARRRTAPVRDEESVEAAAMPRPRTAGEILAAIDERTKTFEAELRSVRRQTHRHANALTAIMGRLGIEGVPKAPNPLGDDDSDSDKPNDSG